MLEIKEEKKLVSFAKEALDCVKGKVDYADLLIETVYRANAKLLEDGREIMFPFSSNRAMQLRLVNDDGRHVEVSLGLNSQLKENIGIALTLLEKEQPSDYKLAPIPNRKRKRYGKVLRQDMTKTGIMSMMHSIIEDLRQYINSLKPNNISFMPQMRIFCQIEEKLIMDSEGIFKTQVLPLTFLQLSLKAKKGSKIAGFNRRYTDIEEIGFLFDRGVACKELKARAKDAVDKVLDLLNARKLSEKELRRVTHYVLSQSSMVFVHEAEGHNFEADGIKEGTSGLFAKDGKPITEVLGSEIVDVFDGPPMNNDRTFDMDKGFGTQYIDDEGVEVRPVQLVMNGKINAKLHNRETAAFYNESPNGRGFSDLGDPRIVRMTNTYLAPAEGVKAKKFDDLIRDISYGVYLVGSMGGAVSKDGMSTSIEVGYLIENGKLTGKALLPSNLAVSTRRALLTVEGFAGSIDISQGSGFCGKSGQTKLVTDGGPITKLRVSKDISLSF